MGRTNRRRFLAELATTTTAVTLLGSCVGKEHPAGSAEQAVPQGSAFHLAMEENRKLPGELLMQLLDQKVEHYMQLSHHCAQSSFMALKEQFGLDGAEVVKALTPLTGIAERGETCGAVTGPLMAMGLIYGRGEQQLNDWETYRASLVPSGKFCAAFEQAFGSTMCHAIQKQKFGRCYQLTDPEELREFQKADATGHCTEVVKKAVRLAAEIILQEAAPGATR
jgi:C_GCAxxG_C_C family probable redox protein